MGWKHIDKLHMGLTPTNNFVGNVDEVESRKKENKKDMGKKKMSVDIVISDKAQVTIMLEIVRYDVSTKVYGTTDIK